MNFSKRRLAVIAFFMAQLNYCPLIWMCHSRTYKNKINRLHERCLQLFYGLESIQVSGPKTWESLPIDLKNLKFENKESVDSFKTAFKRWKPGSCPCHFVKLIYRT